MAGRTKRNRSKRRRLPEAQTMTGLAATVVCVVSLMLVGGIVYLAYRDWAKDHHVHVGLDMAVFALMPIVVSAWAVVQWWSTRRR